MISPYCDVCKCCGEIECCSIRKCIITHLNNCLYKDIYISEICRKLKFLEELVDIVEKSEIEDVSITNKIEEYWKL